MNSQSSHTVSAMRIGNRLIGPGHPVFIVAEAGVSHFGSVDAAFQLIDMAVEAGADAVKFQVFNTKYLISAEAPDWQERMRQKELSPESVERIAAYAKKCQILFFATPHDEGSADLLASIGVAVFKIGSGELSNTPFLRHIAQKRRSIILSTGMCTLNDVREAVQVLEAEGADQLVLLHCVTAYPAAPAEVNLRSMLTLQQTFHVPVGYSDHTVGFTVPLAAVALGASVIEKHIALKKNQPNAQDSFVSCDRADLFAMVQAVRQIEAALGDGVRQPTASELKNREWARKSLVAVQDIPAGTTLSPQMICCKRPGTGIPPNMLSRVLGVRTKVPILADRLIRWEHLETERVG